MIKTTLAGPAAVIDMDQGTEILSGDDLTVDDRVRMEAQYRDFAGLRNEEDLVITENGARCPGKRKPKTVEEVETIRQDAFK